MPSDAPECLTAFDYRDPGQLPEGGVLVVGAAATGVQLADEIRRSGRSRVTLSVGEHVRLPRTYRGRDVLWWMDAAGVWDQRHESRRSHARAAAPLAAARRLAGRVTLDLNALSDVDVELVGRLAAIRDGRALFSGGLRNMFSMADLKMERLLETFDLSAQRQTLGRRRFARAFPRPACRPPLACGSISARRNPRSSGQRGIGRTTAGCTCP